ncbi:MAG: DUF3592 domain-containing protein [Elusimicrobia bacterium]|nr:DUF3592 domain-containing protein [Elusimicrobiota bacterium]
MDNRYRYALAALFFLLAWAVGRERRAAAFRTDNWIKAEAVITGSRALEDRGGRGGGNPFEVIVEYEYSAGGRRYAGAGSADRNTLYTRESAEEAVAGRFGAGNTLDIYYDPADPASSALGLSDASGRFWQAALAVIGLLMLASTRRKA